VIHPSALLNDDPLPSRAALITFDDGFMGSFTNGLAILQDLQVPSVIFLNMKAVTDSTPIMSAVLCYLDRYVPEFSEFAKLAGMPRPYHLTFTPELLSRFESTYGPIALDAVKDYQGAFADLDTVKRWDNEELVVYGNHQYEHWTASALRIDQFGEQYAKNQAALAGLKNSVNMFAFTNGQPDTCFSRLEVDYLNSRGAGKAFAAANGVNRNPRNFLLDRISFYQDDHADSHLWFKLVRARLKQDAILATD
jgi:peptidoglycan/xylan/chitin deacetylase (PgdA/CDA1 family)